jgi:hypothetical protein
MLPPEAMSTASMTLSSTLGKASFKTSLFCCIGLSGRGGFAGAAGGIVAIGEGSKLLSSGALGSALSAILLTVLKRLRHRSSDGEA